MERTLLKEPAEPYEPRPKSVHGKYRESKENVHEIVLFKKKYFSEGALENAEAGNDEVDEDGEPIPKDGEMLDYDNRIDLSDLLKTLPKGVEPRSVYLNIRRDRHFDEFEVTLIHEKPRDLKAEAAEHKVAVAAWKIAHHRWKAEHAAWKEKVHAEKIERAEHRLAMLKQGAGAGENKKLNDFEKRLISSDKALEAIKAFRERTGESLKIAKYEVYEYMDTL